MSNFMLKKIFSRFKKKKTFNFGYIDFISTGYARGWAFSSIHEIDHVTLLVDDKKIQSCKIDINREDIKNLYRTDKKTGFELFFLNEKYDHRKVGKVRFVVEDKNNKELFDLKTINKLKIDELEEIIWNKFYGYDGKIDGINEEGLITGWAAKRSNENKQINIYLQSKNSPPIDIKCERWIYNLSDRKVSSSSSFEIEIESLPQELTERKIYFTFDKEGMYPIDYENSIDLPKIKNNIRFKNYLSIDDNDEIKDYIDTLQELRTQLSSKYQK